MTSARIFALIGGASLAATLAALAVDLKPKVFPLTVYARTSQEEERRDLVRSYTPDKGGCFGLRTTRKQLAKYSALVTGIR
jgi:hypothetical protein